MDMLERTHALQRRPILKPQNMVRGVLEQLRLPGQTIHKCPLDKLLNQLARIIRHVAITLLNRDGGTQPHNQMGDPRGDTVRPVITEDLVIRRIGERDRILEGEDRAAVDGDTVGGSEVGEVPVQTALADVVGDVAVLEFDVAGPGEVSDQIGGFPLQDAQVIAC